MEFFQTYSWCVGDLTDLEWDSWRQHGVVATTAVSEKIGKLLTHWYDEQTWHSDSFIHSAQTNAADWNNNDKLTKKKTGKAL